MALKTFIWILFALMLAGCATRRTHLLWRVKDAALDTRPAVELIGPNQQLMATVPTRVLQDMLLAHIRIGRTANVQSELYITDGEEPNAFAGPDREGRFLVGINIPMVHLIDGDAHEYAALIGHEIAHLAKGHIDASRLRSSAVDLLGTVIGAGLAIGGIPGGGLVGGLAADLVDSVYNRDQEREADAAGVEYMIASGYDPMASVRLQEKFLKLAGGPPLPFLSSHPSGEERVANLKALIERLKATKGRKSEIPLADSAAP